MRRHGRDRGFGFRLAQDRPGGIARGGGALSRQTACPAAVSIHRRSAGRCSAAAARPRSDGLFPRTPRVLATQQALACRAGEIYGNPATPITTMTIARAVVAPPSAD